MPVVDGELLTGQPMAMIASGSARHVEVLVSFEISSFVIRSNQALSTPLHRWEPR